MWFKWFKWKTNPATLVKETLLHTLPALWNRYCNFKSIKRKMSLTLIRPVNNCLSRLALGNIICVICGGAWVLCCLICLQCMLRMNWSLAFSLLHVPKHFPRVLQTMLIKRPHVCRFIIVFTSSGNKESQILLQKWRGDLLPEGVPILG